MKKYHGGVLFKAIGTILTTILTCLPVAAFAQDNDNFVGSTDFIELLADPNPSTNRILPAEEFLPEGESATFVVNYNPSSCETPTTTWPTAAQTAFSYAADLWAMRLEASITVEIDACWRPLDPRVLGNARAGGLWRNFANAPNLGTWYPEPLANQYAGTNLEPDTADVLANFNSNFTNWYFGTDGNPPSTDFDFVTVVMHEIGHGLGFSGFVSVEVNGIGQYGFGTGFPAAYDLYTEDSAGQALIDNPSLYPNPSTTLGNALTSGSIFFDSPAVTAANGGLPAPLYSPSPWEGGSSYSHFSDVFDGTENAMMTHSLSRGEVAHDPGPVGIALLDDIGWTISNMAAPAATTLLSPSGVTVDTTPEYQWEAVSNSSYYQIFVNDNTGNIIKLWLTAAQANCASGSGSCSYTSSTAVSGSAIWWVRTYNDFGIGPWSTPLTFSTGTPVATSLIAPDGSVDASSPVSFSWEAVSDSTWYQLYIENEDSSSLVLDKWYTAGQVSCSSGTGTCGIAPNISLSGNNRWWVRTYNASGNGPWSSSLAFFASSGGVPQAATTVSPLGSGAGQFPTYVWNDVPDSTWYRLYISDGTGVRHEQWYTRNQANCSTASDLCSISPNISINTSSTWWVRTYNSFGNGPWSSGKNFAP